MKIARDRFALGSYQYWRYPLEYFLDTAVELQIPSIELWAAAPQIFLETINSTKMKKVSAQIRERSLKVCCITPEQCSYPVNLASEDDDLRNHSIRNFRRAIEMAHELECRMVLITAGCGYLNRSTEEAWKRSATSIARLAVYALSMGVQLLLETLTPLSSNILNTPEQQLSMIELMPEGSIYAMLDIGQMTYMNHDLSRYLTKVDILRHVHLHDSHPGIHMALGDGDLDLVSILKCIEGSGYHGQYSFEFNDSQYRLEPRAADVRSIDWLVEHNIL